VTTHAEIGAGADGAGIDCAGQWLDLSRPQVMGILNVTPDSFSDGGALFDDGRLSLDKVLEQAEFMVASGAAILDVGGESTRPGATPVSPVEELDRVIPAIEALRARFDTILSVDTSTPTVMEAATVAGAGLINDVRALRREGALQAALASGLPVCLMHMAEEPATMQDHPRYENVVDEVAVFLRQRLEDCMEAGIPRARILLDPGFGFGKTAAHNYALLAQLQDIIGIGQPVLAGLSRKSMIAAEIHRNMDRRLPASLALATLAASKGARILRVHDVRETVDALAMVAATERYAR
jgi:dihydropteroate synthase